MCRSDLIVTSKIVVATQHLSAVTALTFLGSKFIYMLKVMVAPSLAANTVDQGVASSSNTSRGGDPSSSVLLQPGDGLCKFHRPCCLKLCC
jgi:hypothetical protein